MTRWDHCDSTAAPSAAENRCQRFEQVRVQHPVLIRERVLLRADEAPVLRILLADKSEEIRPGQQPSQRPPGCGGSIL